MQKRVMRCSKNTIKVSGKGIRNIQVCGKNFPLIVKCLNEVVAIPCVGDMVEKFTIMVSLGELKRAGSLSPHSFFKTLYSF